MQTLVTIGLVVLATAYVGRATVRTLRSALGSGGSCSNGCGKCAAPVVATPESKRRISLPQV